MQHVLQLVTSVLNRIQPISPRSLWSCSWHKKSVQFLQKCRFISPVLSIDTGSSRAAGSLVFSQWNRSSLWFCFLYPGIVPFLIVYLVMVSLTGTYCACNVICGSQKALLLTCIIYGLNETRLFKQNTWSEESISVCCLVFCAQAVLSYSDDHGSVWAGREIAFREIESYFEGFVDEISSKENIISILSRLMLLPC